MGTYCCTQGGKPARVRSREWGDPLTSGLQFNKVKINVGIVHTDPIWMLLHGGVVTSCGLAVLLLCSLPDTPAQAA